MRGRVLASLWVGWLSAGLLFALPPRALAGEIDCDRPEEKLSLVIVYGNGMFTDVSGALTTLDTLKDTLPHALGQRRQALEFGLAFNYSEAFHEQIMEVVRQRVAADTTPSDLVRYAIGALPLPIGVQDKLFQIATAFERWVKLDEDLERHLQTYRYHLGNDRKIVLIAHSQGNLYANRAYHRLFEIERQYDPNDFAIVGIATPDKEVKGPSAPGCGAQGCYTTLKQDRVIEAVRDNVPGTLPWNVDDQSPTPDAWGHGINDTYLGINAVRKRIYDQIAAQVARFPKLLVEPTPVPMSAYLGWSAGPDLDLHVFEADATEHVYYYAPIGKGRLERDSRMGGSEEEYYQIECGKLAPGRYEFAVGYYEGEGPATANLDLMVGDERYSLSHTFERPQGPEADDFPESLAWVIVEDDGAGWYEFDVAPVE